MSATNPDDDELRASPGYVLGQMARVLRTAQHHDDPETRSRAAAHLERFEMVLRGMLSGSLDVGSRVPVGGTPPWATLEVVKGGFATGNLLAEGPLRPHEIELAGSLPGLALRHDDAADDAARARSVRTALNAYYLGEAGLAELRARLADGCYRIELPEEGALLAVAWLVERGETDAARDVLVALAPFLERLRFYPVPHAAAPVERGLVHVQALDATRADLARIRVRTSHEKLRETIRVWAPIEDRLVSLVLETLSPGDSPTLELDDALEPRVDARGMTEVLGAWPFQQYPEGWSARAGAALGDLGDAMERHRLCAVRVGATSNLVRIASAVRTAVAEPRALTGADVARTRRILASIAHKRGLPGSEQNRGVRDRQARQIARPTTHDAARVVLDRMRALPGDEGLAQIDPWLAPLSADEASRSAVSPGSTLAPSLGGKLLRSWDASPADLVGRGVITSSEMLARVLPQISAEAVAAGIADPALRRLHRAIYAAFRRRRSLLLLYLQHQIRIEELPWVAAIERHRVAGDAERLAARRTLEQVIELAITGFPHVILPNKLLSELRALVERAGLRVPVVNEIAADIFMGQLTEKYLHAAKRAAPLLEGKLYATYYGIDCAAVRAIDDVTASRWGAPTSAAFVAMCYARAGQTGGARGSVAANGAVIEQEQILTTHNLATLSEPLGLLEKLAPEMDPLARRVLEWIAREQRKRIVPWRGRLHALKATAYAWRQMVFFLSWVSPATLDVFLAWGRDHIERAGPRVALRLGPALAGLAMAAAGQAPDPRLLGWATSGKHWLLED